MLHEVLGRPPVVRCGVCHKPSETGVPPECRRVSSSRQPRDCRTAAHTAAHAREQTLTLRHQQQAMDRSRSPHVPRNVGNGQASYDSPLSDEARFPQKLAERLEMQEATAAVRAAVQAEWACAVEGAVNKSGRALG